MSEIETGWPAFPHEYKYGDGTADRAEGMTLRDYFAAHAPTPPESWHGGERRISDVVHWSWYYADAMVEARKQ